LSATSEWIEVLLRGVDHFRGRRALIGVHALKARRDGKLHHAGLGAHEGRDEAHVHWSSIMALKFKKA
jgi:hypothetical protein